MCEDYTLGSRMDHPLRKATRAKTGSRESLDRVCATVPSRVKKPPRPTPDPIRILDKRRGLAAGTIDGRLAAMCGLWDRLPIEGRIPFYFPLRAPNET